MTDSWAELKRRLDKLAEDHGFKAELARRMGVAPPSVQRYFSGERTPGLAQLDKIAEALGEKPWDLIKPENAETTQDPLLAQILAIWWNLDDEDKRSIANLAKRLADSSTKDTHALSKKKKAGS